MVIRHLGYTQSNNVLFIMGLKPCSEMLMGNAASKAGRIHQV